mmetsp:Transcript_21151/g.47675  ORF Transcript_21151/g.47675 Transcript_21151/m.47675 type:complete len:203 (-) Transcript_21151:407-1015(-)
MAVGVAVAVAMGVAVATAPPRYQRFNTNALRSHTGQPRMPEQQLRGSESLLASEAQQRILPTWQVHHIGGTGQGVRDLLRSLDATDLYDSLAKGLHGLHHQHRSLRVALGTDDGSALLLLLQLDNELLALRLLLGHLLLFDCLGKLLAVIQMSDGDILNDNSKLVASLCDPVPNLLRHPLSHCQQSLRIILGYDTLQDLIAH